MERFSRALRLPALLFALLLPGLAAGQAPQPPFQRPPALTLPSARLDADSLAQRHLALSPRTATLNLPQLAGKRIVNGDGSEEALDRVATRLFADNAAFEARARRVSPNTLAGPPQTAVEAFELPDSFLLLRNTRVVVLDPPAFARVSPEFASFMAERAAQTASYAALKPEQKAGVDGFLATEARRLPPNDPLAVAARQGREALVRAVAEGKGEFEIVDTFVVPKAPLPKLDGRLQLPQFDDGVLRLDRLRTIDSRLLRSIAIDRNLTLPPPPPPEQPSVGREGAHRFEQPFLTGFTLGNSWNWERRWNYPSGFFRISLGAGYGIGLRVPLKIDGHISPGGITRRAPTDHADALRVTLTGAVLDAAPDFFRRTGLDNDLVMNGDEFVLNAGFYYGLKFNVFWSDVVHIRRQDVGIDLNRDWRAPFGSDGGSGRIVIPASLTRTELNLGVLSGKAEAGFSIAGRGEIGLDYEFSLDGRVVRRQGVALRGPQPVIITEELPALNGRPVGEEASRKFGVRLSNPVYRGDLSVTPQANVSIRVGVDGFSRRFSTGWMSFNRFRLDLGRIELGRHAGTVGQYRFADGYKSFTRIAGAAADTAPPLPKFAAFRSRATGQIVRAGATDRTLLAAVSSGVGAWERFEIVPLADGRVALKATQNGRFVRGGLDQRQSLAAVSPRAQAWETFTVVRLDGGGVALRNFQNGRYVTVDNEGFLQSNAEQVGRRETFEIVALR